MPHSASVLASKQSIATDKAPDPETLVATVIEDAEVLHASLKAASIAQIVIALTAVIFLLYFLRYVLVICFTAMLAAFILEPVVNKLARYRVPRPAGAFLAVALGSFLAGALGYFLLIQIEPISRELPKYSDRIRQGLNSVQEPLIRLEKSARAVTMPPGDGDDLAPVQVQEAPTTSRFIASNFGTIGELLLAVSFLPCITFFMLTWKDHAHSATVRLFPEEHREVAYRTSAKISRMIRGFLVGNMIVWAIGAVTCTALFWYAGIPFFYFIGAVCGFLSLIPTVGAILAIIPPVVGGIGILHASGFLIVVIGVFLIHVVTLNLLYPKLVGKRVLLNPLAVILALLIWAWIWGAMGLVLAIPIVAAVKIVCDHTDSLKGFGAWLGI